MCIQTIKSDDTRIPDHAKNQIVTLGNHESSVWKKADIFVLVLYNESSHIVITLAVKIGEWKIKRLQESILNYIWITLNTRAF